MVKCPVCGMDVDPGTAPNHSEFQGKTYYFCCSECKRQFDSDPMSYARQNVMAEQRSCIRDE